MFSGNENNAIRGTLRVASNMQSQFTRLEQILLSQLECPVCMQYMRPPITLCENGHNICDICRPKLRHCPTCRQQILNARNVALEKVIREVNYPCMYRYYGCRETYSFDMIGGHQEKCRYIPQPCPVDKLNFENCTWTGIRSSMTSHLKKAHSDRCDEYCSFYEGSICVSDVTTDKVRYKFLFVGDDIFCSRTEIVDGMLYSVLYFIGPAADAAKYMYKVEFFGAKCGENLAVTHMARCWDEDLSEVHNSGNCMKLYPEQFNRFANERGELKFSMEIITVRHNYPHDYY
jgi:E3 ubiquitin-protein ligase SIAH1